MYVIYIHYFFRVYILKKIILSTIETFAIFFAADSYIYWLSITYYVIYYYYVIFYLRLAFLLFKIVYALT